MNRRRTQKKKISLSGLLTDLTLIAVIGTGFIYGIYCFLTELARIAT